MLIMKMLNVLHLQFSGKPDEIFPIEIGCYRAKQNNTDKILEQMFRKNRFDVMSHKIQ